MRAIIELDADKFPPILEAGTDRRLLESDHVLVCLAGKAERRAYARHPQGALFPAEKLQWPPNYEIFHGHHGQLIKCPDGQILEASKASPLEKIRVSAWAAWKKSNTSSGK